MTNYRDKLCLLMCRNYIREIEKILGSAGFDDVIAREYPPACSAPHLAPDAVREIVLNNQREGYDTLLVSGCFFSERRLLTVMPQSCEIYNIEQCFYLLAGKELTDDYLKAGAYVLSPGWLTEWPAHIAQWGFDRNTARAFFGESVNRLVLLDTGIYERSVDMLAEFAEHIDRTFLVVPVGLDYFRLLITGIIFKWRLEKTNRKWQSASEQLSRKIADQAMSFDLLVGLTRMKTEAEAIEQIMNLFSMLFAPGRMVYASTLDGRIGRIYSYPSGHADSNQFQEWMEKGRTENTWIEEQSGFNLRLAHLDQTLGLLEVRDITFPEYQREYLNLAVLLSRVCGLAIANGRLFQEVRHQAITDSLTSLFNRRHFMSLAKREFLQAIRYERPLAALMLDVDHFKKINDTYGHFAGDRALVEIARLCRNELRDTDIYGRYGGEEFVFLLSETAEEGACQMAERLRKSISQMNIVVEGRTVKVTASLGVALLDADCLDIEALLDRSDQALYAAKRGGRNRVVVYGSNGVNEKEGRSEVRHE
jgi:diguanylate cyclase (GGDEF)-like protein